MLKINKAAIFYRCRLMDFKIPCSEFQNLLATFCNVIILDLTSSDDDKLY